MSNGPTHDVSVAERPGHIAARPVSWLVVVLVCAGFLVAGIGLIAAQPWLFWLGVGVVAVGVVIGGATHAMADVTARVERKGRPVRGSVPTDAATH
jgi:hypothetical protein